MEEKKNPEALLLAGNTTFALSLGDGIMSIHIAQISFSLILSTKLRKNLQVTKKTHTFADTKLNGAGCSAVGSAHVWGARGRKFESCHPDLRRESCGSLFLFCGYSYRKGLCRLMEVFIFYRLLVVCKV